MAEERVDGMTKEERRLITNWIWQTALFLLLDSPWALIPALLSAAAFVLRIYWEDQTLLAEMEGYREYAGRMRCRLFSGVW